MRSIRLALIVYFLILLAAAVGAVSAFAYQTTSRTLQAREASEKSHREGEYKDACNNARAAFDKRISRHAAILRGRAWTTVRFYENSLPYFGALGAGVHPASYLAMPLWLASGQVPDRALYDPSVIQRFFELYRAVDLHVDVDEDDPVMAEGFFQYYTGQGKPLRRSRSLGEEWFTLSPTARQRLELFRNRGQREAAEDEEGLREYFDNVEIRPGHQVRRVTLIAPARFMPFDQAKRLGLLPPELWRFRPSEPKPPAANIARETPPAPKGPPPRPRRNIFVVQYASETTPLDSTLQALQTRLEERLAQLQEETVQTLADLRRRLLWIFAAMLVGIVVGGYWLVRLGLSPLERLSEAVSRVSEKDFRLQMDGPLPGELKPIVARLTETLDQLKRAFAREKQAAADISHELRTPLAALLTTLDVALKKPRPAEEYQEILEECRASGKQMTQLVERLLALARLDAGVDHLRPRDVDVANLASQCTDLVRPLASARGLSVRLHARGPVTLQADPDKLREVLTNLLHNAIEYNKPNGSIDVTVGRENGHLRVEVRDTGIGIAPGAREHIFERFYRADPSRHADTLHAGIGLAIVKGYMDLMGGRIDVESSSAGSTFRLEFPVRPSAAETFRRSVPA